MYLVDIGGYNKRRSRVVMILTKSVFFLKVEITDDYHKIITTSIKRHMVWSMTKNNAFGGEKQNKKSNGKQSGLCDLEQVTLKPQLQAHHCLTTWLQIWYHSLLWGDSIQKGADLEKQNCLFGVNPAVMGQLTTPTHRRFSEII